MTGFRVYYECYEQAVHFIAPILRSINGSVPIEFLRLTGIKESSVIAQRLARGLALKNPDIVVSCVHEGIEHGLAWIEISTAVDTQDHDLQRFDSMVACSLANTNFVKIWARRQSRNDHGGQLIYDRQLSLKVGRQMLGVPTIELEWPVNADASEALRHKKYRACPPNDLGLRHVLEVALNGVEDFRDSRKNFLENSTTESWLKEMLITLSEPMDEYRHGRSTRLFRDSSGFWTLKFNRWGHAMDPERGMAWFYSTLFKCKLRGQLWDKTARSTSEAIENFASATGIILDGLGDGDSFSIDAHISRSRVNSAGRAILANCCSFEIFDSSGTDKLVTLSWSVSLEKLLQSSVQTDSRTRASPFKKTEEDDVTYAVACSMYPSNGFDVESVSYPGAQGDRALLEGSGRSVKRTYIDVIAQKSVNGKRLVALTESKGKNAPSVLSDDARKVAAWRDDASKRKVLSDALGNGEIEEVVVSVAAPGARMQPFPNAADVDFVVTVEVGRWVIWPRAGRVPPGFSVLEGTYTVLTRLSY